jgi:endogenous inhibitor of DNA gyrase (YacG/DUF329 family)
MRDLGNWVEERYRIPDREVDTADESIPDPEGEA